MRDDLASYEREMEAKVEERTETLTRQTAQLDSPGRRNSEALRTDLTSSIDYACRIQGAILPSESLRRGVFDRQFVLYMPRDGVSGDFPWFHKLDAWRMFAADCTGHGVPGAFMSLLGHNALQHIGKVYTQPGNILDRLNEHARNVLHRRGQHDGRSRDRVPDGMTSPTSINLEERKLEFAGANAPWATTCATARSPNSSPTSAPSPASNPAPSNSPQVIDLEDGDAVYCASDGYQDQFGGPKGANSCANNSASCWERSPSSRWTARSRNCVSALSTGARWPVKNRWTTS